MKNLLSICIPTYKGEFKLKQSLKTMLPYIKFMSVPIYICDNASPDNTQQYIAELQNEYDNIFYTRNEENIGADRNFEKVLKLSNSKFCWLLGDDDIIKCEVLEEVIDQLNEDSTFDFICVNAFDRIKNLPTQVMTGGKEVINKLGAHLTFMSALIFKRELLNEIDFSKFNSTWFLQTGIVYSLLANEKAKTLWISNNALDSIALSECSWSNQHFYTFTSRIYLFSILLPDYYNKHDKNIFVKSHAKYLGNLYVYLILARIRGELSIKKLFKYHKHIYVALGLKYFLFSILLCLIPQFIIKSTIKIRKSIMKNKNIQKE